MEGSAGQEFGGGSREDSFVEQIELLFFDADEVSRLDFKVFGLELFFLFLFNLEVFLDQLSLLWS